MPRTAGRPPGHVPDGAKIKQLRVDLGIPTSEFARQLGRHPESLYPVENANRPISDVFASQIARALGVPVAEILQEPEAALETDKGPPGTSRRATAGENPLTS